MTNVVIGSRGMVGRALMEHLSDAIGTFHNNQENAVEGRKYEYLDITQSGQVYHFLESHKPQKIFIAAANPHVDGCENPDTDKVNVEGIRRIVNNAYRLGSLVVFFSSSYVFDGESKVPYKTDDATSPINRYGRQKEKVERFIQEYPGLRWVIVRTVGVFGKEATPKNFVAQVARAVKNGRKIYVPADQMMNPVYAIDLAKTVVHITDRYDKEIFHVAGDKCMSKYEFAISVAYRMGCKNPHDLIVGMKSEDMKQVAIRPLNGCLDCRGLQKYAIKVPGFNKGLRKYLKEEGIQ